MEVCRKQLKDSTPKYAPLAQRCWICPILLLVLAGLIPLRIEAQTSGFKVIYTFTGETDGITPKASPIIGKGGVLYGTTFGDYFGPAEDGSAWSLTPPTTVGDVWTETTLFDFTLLAGNYLAGTLALGRNGMLYGATTEGGTGQGIGPGTLFSLTPPATPESSWTEQTLGLFEAAVGSGSASNVVFGAGGDLYGTTFEGAADNQGAVYVAVHPADAGGSWTIYPVHTFGSYPGDGTTPGEGLVVGKGGVLYGSTIGGGSYGYGTVYSVTPPTTSGGGWTEQVLHSFNGIADGTYPLSILTIDKNGVLYGTTGRGPIGDANGCGTVFLLAPPSMAGGTWTFENVYAFRGGPDGCGSAGGVVFGKDGVSTGQLLPAATPARARSTR